MLLLSRKSNIHSPHASPFTVPTTISPLSWSRMSSSTPCASPLAVARFPARIEAKKQDETPVAVARLRPSQEYPGTWVLDSMHCWLKKEDTNPSCDGGSEHAEALSVGMDALLLHHLQQSSPRFDCAICTKATLVSKKTVGGTGIPASGGGSVSRYGDTCVVARCVHGAVRRSSRQYQNKESGRTKCSTAYSVAIGTAGS